MGPAGNSDDEIGEPRQIPIKVKIVNSSDDEGDNS